MADASTAVIIQCPQCRTRYRVPAEQFAGQAQLRVRCTKCATIFETKAPVGMPEAEAAPASSRLPDATVVSKKSGFLPDGKSVALSVVRGPQKGKVFPLNGVNVVLGRTGSDIVIDDPEISRKHCALEVQGTTALLVDLDSTNGTFVDDRKIRSHKLEHLSEFRIGTTIIMFTVTTAQG